MLFLMGSIAGPPMPDFTPALTRRYLAEARTLAEKDGGRLWGKSLDGPLMFVDPKTRQIAANHADAGGLLNLEKGIYVGNLPTSTGISNTSLEWSGTRWTMVMWPLPIDGIERARLMMHESFHRIQPALGFGDNTPISAHLHEEKARVLLQLEYRALASALSATSKPKSRAAWKDALRFRIERWKAYAKAEALEAPLEEMEGLAEYTGFRLSGQSPAAARKALAARLAAHVGADNYTRSFAYDTGPAYGLLLDTVMPLWRTKALAHESLTALATQATGGGSDDSEPLSAVEGRYGGAEIRDKERALARVRADQAASYRRLLVAGPVLALRLSKPQIVFNPSNVVPLGENGDVYPTLTVIDEWGKLTVMTGGALLQGWKVVRVSAPNGPTPDGPGWKLELAKGWTIVPAEKAGSFELKRAQ